MKGASKIKEDTFSISDCQPLKVEVYLLETCVSSLLRYFEGKLEEVEDVANERKLRAHRVEDMTLRRRFSVGTT